MGQLWDLYVAYRDRQPFPPSLRQVARRIEMSPTALGNWQTPITRIPERHNLLAFADLIGVAYQRVLDAALHDAGYLPEKHVRGTAAIRRLEEMKAVHRDGTFANQTQLDPAQDEDVIAARTGESVGRRRRRALDQIPDENQDAGE